MSFPSRPVCCNLFWYCFLFFLPDNDVVMVMVVKYWEWGEIALVGILYDPLPMRMEDKYEVSGMVGNGKSKYLPE